MSRLTAFIRLISKKSIVSAIFCTALFTVQPAQAIEQADKLAKLLKAEKYEDAIKLLQKQSDKGEVAATYLLAMMYDHGRGTEQNFDKAFELFMIGAKTGHHPSENSVGQAYNNGKGVELDHAKAVEWFRKAAEGGNATAQYNLGLRYSLGEGVDKDEAKALEWFLKAAEQDNPFGQYNAAYAYATAAGTEKNMIEALKWAKLASEKGFKPAVVFTSFLASKTTEEERKAALDKIGAFKMQQAGLVDLNAQK